MTKSTEILLKTIEDSIGEKVVVTVDNIHVPMVDKAGHYLGLTELTTNGIYRGTVAWGFGECVVLDGVQLGSEICDGVHIPVEHVAAIGRIRKNLS